MRAKVHAHIDCITRIFSFYFPLGKGNTGLILLYFIINLKKEETSKMKGLCPPTFLIGEFTFGEYISNIE